MYLFLYYFSGIFICIPIFEWFMHYLLHIIYNDNHKLHHLAFHNNKVRIERWPIYTLIIFLYLNWHIMIILNLKYYIFHTIIHKYPNICNGLFKCYANHHLIHHKHPEYNYGVSSIWVDKLFKTYYK